MLDLCHEVLYVTTGVEGAAIVLTNTALLESNNITYLNNASRLLSCFTPDSDLHAALRVITHCDTKTVLRLTSFHFNLGDRIYLKYGANYVDCHILWQHF